MEVEPKVHRMQGSKPLLIGNLTTQYIGSWNISMLFRWNPHHCCLQIFMLDTLAGCWLVVWNIFFPYIGNNNTKWLIFFRRVETTNQTTFYFPPFRTTLTQFIFWMGGSTTSHVESGSPWSLPTSKRRGNIGIPKLETKNWWTFIDHLPGSRGDIHIHWFPVSVEEIPDHLHMRNTPKR